MAKTRLSEKATYVTRGYGQVEPNHLSAQYNGRIHAQWPAAKDVKILENGQFVKYDPETNCVSANGVGEWMLVFNEIKVYWPHQADQDFALKAEDYFSSIYSPVGPAPADATPAETVDYSSFIVNSDMNPTGVDKLTGPARFTIPELMPEGTRMVPRVFFTQPGDIMTTNTIVAEPGSLSVGDELKINADGYLAPDGTDQLWQVSKVYTMPDGQPGVKVIRIQ